MNACELTASITAIANWLACQLTQEQLELLGVSLNDAARHGRRSGCSANLSGDQARSGHCFLYWNTHSSLYRSVY